MKDAENNYVLLDDYNRPVKNTGITLLLDQKGKPVLNSKSTPILIDKDGNPINLDNNNDLNNQNINKSNQGQFYQNPKFQENNNKFPKKKKKEQQIKNRFYQKINSIPKNHNNQNKRKISNNKDLKNNKKHDNIKGRMVKNNNWIIGNHYNNNSSSLSNREKRNIRDKREKGKLNYSQCNLDSIKKINFMRENHYRGQCFACDLGCSVSRSGYSPMNYSPYNNMIRRREHTPLKYREKEEYEEPCNIKANKTGIENDNNYYLTEV